MPRKTGRTPGVSRAAFRNLSHMQNVQFYWLFWPRAFDDLTVDEAVRFDAYRLRPLGLFGTWVRAVCLRFCEFLHW